MTATPETIPQPGGERARECRLAIVAIAQESTLPSGPWTVEQKDYRSNQAVEGFQDVLTDYGARVASVHITAWKQKGRDARPTAHWIAAARTRERALAEAVLELADEAHNLRVRVSDRDTVIENQRRELRKMQKRASTIEAEVEMRIAASLGGRP
jgi:hypothetical protein